MGCASQSKEALRISQAQTPSAQSTKSAEEAAPSAGKDSSSTRQSIAIGESTPPLGAETETSSQTAPKAAGSSEPSKPAVSQIYGVSFVDAEHGWMTEGAVILATNDGGHTWQQLFTAPSQVQHGIQRITRTQGWYADGEGLFVTRDGGVTWEKVLDASFLYGRFQFVDEIRGWIRLYPSDFKTTKDGGKSWSTVQNPCNSGGLFSFIDANTGWMVCATGGGAGLQTKKLFKTDDGGRTWNLIAETGRPEGPQGKMPLSSYAEDLFFLDSQYGWLGTAKGDLLVTNDGGVTWQALPRLGDLTTIAKVQFLTPQKGYIVAIERSSMPPISRLLTTSDGGKTWTEVYGPTNDR